ncbi:capsule biosynthesis protein [Bordetella genomosp. 13]|uniref:capsule biosynthesis protein n=1 Tax=Bordetella genomosp. 13 TaxID=463040 RepID=UPI0021B4EA7C|nr:capsular biosynthesis protein [Bordetella genomosp. 13]
MRAMTEENTDSAGISVTVRDEPKATGQCPPQRSFVLLQGVSSPFFRELGLQLRNAGCRVSKVNFTVGDQYYWRGPDAEAYRGTVEQLPAFYEALFARKAATDLVVFGDQRPIHRCGVEIARRSGLRVHVFEEGYFRPYWLTLERGGVNANSQLPRDAGWYREVGKRLPRYGNGQAFTSSFLVRAWHDVVYNSHGLRNRWQYPGYQGHAPHSAWTEYAAYVRKALSSRSRARRDVLAVNTLIRQDRLFFLLPLQLNSDSQIRHHSLFGNMATLAERVMRSFAQSAPAHAVLVVKNHPLDPGIDRHEHDVRRLANQLGIQDRVVFLESGHLPTLLSHAAGVVTVNSTVGGSALVHARPTIALGKAIYDLPGLTFQGGLDAFWHDAEPPDMTLFQHFRNVVIHTTQVNGGFYTREGISMAVQRGVERMLAERSPLEMLL